MKKRALYFVQALLNSYAIVFFSQSTVLGALLLAVSFFNPAAGLAGLLCAGMALFVVNALNYEQTNIQAGLYSFNALLAGIGMGTFYHCNNAAFWVWLAAACLLTVMLSVGLAARLGRYNLPLLSLPFVLVFWMVLAAGTGYASTGLMPKESYILNELATARHAASPMLFAFADYWKLPFCVKLFCRALSAVFFQDSVMAGLIISIGVFIHSRISFSLLVLGFAATVGFNALMGIYPGGINPYHLGVNFMMTTLALGGFFLIPSARSYLWALVAGIPVTFLFIGAFSKVLLIGNLPALSLPFCACILIMLYFLMLRTGRGKLSLTPLQYYSPEENLYHYINSNERLHDSKYLRLNLPFMGSWTVTQGYNGNITHKAGWGQALDFVIADEEGKTFQQSGLRPENYYCYGKPVLACADGVIEAVINHIEDNTPSKVNTLQNWGNSVVIKHAEGMYSQVSHLKQNSVKVTVGDRVKQGDLLGQCGNSGRSPEPHLHFQVQVSPYIGSQTLAYPFAYFITGQAGNAGSLHSFEVPAQGMTVTAVQADNLLKQAFAFQPGYSTAVSSSDSCTEYWEVHTDALNYTYLYSHSTGATAYFVNNGTVFYFTAFYGERSSLLYLFYLAAYKVVFTVSPVIEAEDAYPLNLAPYHAGLWLQDMLAPFFQFIKRKYKSGVRQDASGTTVFAAGYQQVFGRSRQVMESSIQISGNTIAAFSITQEGKKIDVQWHTGSIG